MALTAAEEAQTRELLAQQAAILALANQEPAIISSLGATDVSLSDLTPAVSLGDTDLLLVRQGVTDKSIAGSIVKATGAQPDASETVKGIVELATVAEAQAGTDTVRAVTPAGLASVTSTETRSGLIELATAAEAQALTDAVRAISPARLASALGGSNQSLAASGYQKFPGGLIIQWGAVPAINSASTAIITFPLAFPTACRSVQITRNTSTVTSALAAFCVQSVTASTFVAVNGTTVNNESGYWMAIGY